MKYGYNENGDKIYENIHGYYYDENGDCYYVYKPSINHTKWNKENGNGKFLQSILKSIKKK